MDANLRERIVNAVDASFGEQLDVLARLVSYESVTGKEGPAQEFFAGLCRETGMETGFVEASLDAVSRHPGYIEIGLPYEGRPNVVAKLPGTGGGRSLILNGHIDVVSPEPVSDWTGDPWKARVGEGRMYGRGTVDMKGGLSACLFAAKAVLASGLALKGDLVLESVIEEELGGSGGTLACLLSGVKADGMAIAEPSSEVVWIGHPGIMYFRVKVKGRPAHASRSQDGVNAIGKMVPIIRALEALDEARAARLTYPLLEKVTGRPCNLSAGIMRAGDWVSTVAGWAVLEGRVGFVPGEEGPAVRQEVEGAIRDAVAGDEWFAAHPPEVEWFGWNASPWVTPVDSEIVRAVRDAAMAASGAVPEVGGCSGGLDARFGSMFGVPSIAFGPTGGNYHGVDEFVDLDSLKRVTKALALLVAAWCA